MKEIIVSEIDRDTEKGFAICTDEGDWGSRKKWSSERFVWLPKYYASFKPLENGQFLVTVYKQIIWENNWAEAKICGQAPAKEKPKKKYLASRRMWRINNAK